MCWEVNGVFSASEMMRKEAAMERLGRKAIQAEERVGAKPFERSKFHCCKDRKGPVLLEQNEMEGRKEIVGLSKQGPDCMDLHRTWFESYSLTVNEVTETK